MATKYSVELKENAGWNAVANDVIGNVKAREVAQDFHTRFSKKARVIKIVSKVIFETDEKTT